jgi:hypothetical protein
MRKLPRQERGRTSRGEVTRREMEERGSGVTGVCRKRVRGWCALDPASVELLTIRSQVKKEEENAEGSEDCHGMHPGCGGVCQQR